MNDNAKLWVRRLRSGLFPQGRRRLNREGNLCCLGVACEVAIANGVELSKDTTRETVMYGRELYTLPSVVMEWLGLRTKDGMYLFRDEAGLKTQSLTSDNDSGKTFEEIADIIEAHTELFFDDEEQEAPLVATSTPIEEAELVTS